MSGRIGLRVEREPEFDNLCRIRGGDGQTFVAIDGSEIVGCMSTALKTYYFSGSPKTAAYVADFKVSPERRGSVAAMRLIECAAAYLRARNVDSVFCIAAEGNEKVIPIVSRRHASVPRFCSMGTFRVYQLLPSPIRSYGGGIEIANATHKDVDEICDLLNSFSRSYTFAPSISADDLAFGVDSSTKTFVARKQEQIVAVVSVSDFSSAKQMVVASMPKPLETCLRGLRAASRVVPFPWRLPLPGEQVRLLYARNFACRKLHEASLRALFQRIRHETFRGGHTFLTVAIHERDPLRAVLRVFPRYTVPVLGFMASLAGNEEALGRSIAGRSLVDIAIV